MASIEITATSDGNQPVVSVLAGNLDFDEVAITHHQYAVKALIPIEMLVTVPTGYLLTKFLIEPMVGPVADKWKKTVARHLHPLTPFNLTIKITEENQVYEAPLGTNHQITSEVWDIVQKTIDILKMENTLAKVSKVKFLPGDSGELLVFCYQQEVPTLMMDLDKGRTAPIPSEKMPKAIEAEAPLETFERVVTETADAHRQAIEKLHQDRNG